MSTPSHIRLRQICLATLDLPKQETALSNILGLDPCHKSQLDEFGLENTLFAINGTFIELVAPTTANTAVHRFLERSNGVGGYMAIFDCDDVPARKKAAADLGIEPIYEKTYPGADLLQLNPRQTGITLVEFDHHRGGEDMLGHYEWAGRNWQKGINTDLIQNMRSITLSCSDPQSRSIQWSPLFGRDVKTPDVPLILPLDYGALHFENNSNKGSDCFSGLQLTSHSVLTVLDAARKEGYPVTNNTFSYCGVTFEILAT